MSIKKRGIVASLWALILPGIFLFLTLLVQLHLQNMRRAEIENIALQAIQKSFLLLQAELAQLADRQKQALCNVEEPPSVCASENPFDFLTEADKADTILKTHPQVWQEVKTFIQTHDPKENISPSYIQIYYPYFPENPWLFCTVNMKVEVRYHLSFFEESFFPQKISKIATQSYVSLE